MMTFLTFLGALPALVVTGAFISRFYGDSRIGARERWTFCILGAAMVGACALIYPAWRAHPLYGTLHALLAYNGLFWLAVSAAQPRWLTTSHLWMVTASLVLTGVATTVAVWVAVVPQIGPAKHSAINEYRQPEEDAQIIAQSAASISDSLDSVQDNLRREQKKVDAALTALTDAADQRLAELEELSQQRDRVITELRDQEALLELSERELIAFRRELRRGKVWEYLLGLLVGIGSSICGYFLTRLVKSRFG